MKTFPPFTEAVLEAISRVLGDTSDGLTGSEINHLLNSCRIPNVDPHATKWKRIYNALANYQNESQRGNHVIGFIHKAMKPVRYTSDQDLFDWRQEELNLTLLFAGLEVGKDGKLRRVKTATTLDDARESE